MTVYGTCLTIYNDKRLTPNTHSQYRVVVLAKSKAAAKRAIAAAGHRFPSTLELTPTHNEQELAAATIEGRLYAKGLYEWNSPLVAIS